MYFIPLCTLNSSKNWLQKSCPNRLPTLTYGLSRATQFFYCSPFRVATDFSKVSFVVVTFSFSFNSYVKIPFVVYEIMGAFSYFAFSFLAYFIMPCAATSSHVTENGSSCNGSIFYTKVCCSTLIWFIYWCNCLFSTIVAIHSIGGRVLIVSLIFYAFSCGVCNLYLNAYSYAFSNN